MADREAWAAFAKGSTKRKAIALDLDDVILDFTGGVREAVQREYGVSIPEFTDWEMAKWLNPVIGGSWWNWMKARDWLWKTFPSVEGAIGNILRLRQAGYFLEIVTSKPDWAEASVWQWLGRWRPAVHRVTIVNEKQNKADFSDALILVDDKPQNCEEWVASQPARYAILYDRSHNRYYETSAGTRIMRAGNWQEVYDAIRGLMP